MSVDLKPYPAMKDSGVPWLGEVPTYWEVVRFAQHLRNAVTRGLVHVPASRGPRGRPDLRRLVCTDPREPRGGTRTGSGKRSGQRRTHSRLTPMRDRVTWPDLEAALQARDGWRRVGREYHGPCPVTGRGP